MWKSEKDTTTLDRNSRQVYVENPKKNEENYEVWKSLIVEFFTFKPLLFYFTDLPMKAIL